MRYNSCTARYRSHSPTGSQKWDPEDVMRLTNSATGSVTCIGYATTKRRRCQRHIAIHKTMYARGILDSLADEEASEAAKSPRLPHAVNTMLCWQHDGQALMLLGLWKASLLFTVPGVVVKDEYEDPSFEEMKETIGQLQEYSFGPYPDMIMEILELYGGRNANRKSKAEGTKRRGQARQGETSWYAQEEKRKEEERREAEERLRKQEEELRRERQRKEEERRRKEEQARVKAERIAREEMRRKEEERRRREEEAREKVEKEAREWSAAWTRYSDAWEKGANVSIANIPWPVKSGLQVDVDEDNVKQFFAKAPPESLAGSGEKRFKFISAENKKWHTDKVMQRFGPGVTAGPAKKSLDIIARVLIQLRQEAQKNR